MEFDLHIHTSYSFDSSMSPAEAVERAIEVDLAGIAITDHDSVDGIQEAIDAAGDRLIIVPGIEVTTEVGDIIGYFIDDDIEEDEAVEVIRQIKSRGGLVALPHPSRGTLAEFEDLGLAAELDLVEAFNGRRHKLQRVLEFGGEPFILDFAERHGIPVIAGSDAHSTGDIGSGRSVLPASTLDDVRRSLDRGNSLCTGRKTGWVSSFFNHFQREPDEDVDDYEDEN